MLFRAYSEARVVEWACNHLRKQPRLLAKLICTCHNGAPKTGVAESHLVFVSAPPRGERIPRDARVIHQICFLLIIFVILGMRTVAIQRCGAASSPLYNYLRVCTLSSGAHYVVITEYAEASYSKSLALGAALEKVSRRINFVHFDNKMVCLLLF